MLAVAMPIVLLTTAFGEIMIEIFFGTSFMAARWPLFLLSLAQFINVGIGAVGSLLIMTGNERDAVRAVAATTVFNLVLCVALIPRWGTFGAAIAMAITLVTLNMIMLWSVRFRLGIKSTPW